MNIEIANRLVELRKKSGLSQEDLASKLGLSRQAVSKWERAEASPDTDNLICLAKLYGVSLDTLLNTDESLDDIVKEQVKPEVNEDKTSTDDSKNGDASNEKKDDGSSSYNKSESFHIGSDGIHIHDDEDDVDIDKEHGVHVDSHDGTHVHIGSDGIHIHDKNGNDHDYGPDYKADFIYGNNSRSHHFETAQAIASSIVSLLCVAAYLCCGFLIKDAYLGWGVCWLVFFIIPLVSSFIEALRYHSFTKFAFPVLVVGLYVLFGMLYKAWHPEWVIFFAIPLYYSIFKPIDKLIREHDFKNGKSSLKVHLSDDDDKDDDDDVIDIDAK
jgi:transcriptional regulator with XRE-family HTH domain